MNLRELDIYFVTENIKEREREKNGRNLKNRFLKIIRRSRIFIVENIRILIINNNNDHRRIDKIS